MNAEQINSLFIKMKVDREVALKTLDGGIYATRTVEKGQQFRHASGGTDICLARTKSVDGQTELFFNFDPEDVTFC